MIINRRFNVSSISKYTRRGFIILAVVVLITAIMFFLMAFYWLPQIEKEHRIRILEKKIININNDNYASIPEKILLREKEYFEIVDITGKVLFCSNSERENIYSKEIIKDIPDINSDDQIYITFVKNNKEKAWIYFSYNSKVNEQLAGIAVLDTNGKIVYNGLDSKQDKLFEKSANYLILNSKDEGLLIQKQEFKNENGEDRVLLVHINTEMFKQNENVKNKMVFIFICYCMIVVIIITAMGDYYSKKMVVPITKISDAIVEIPTGRRVLLNVEDEPKEFQELICTFNRMEHELWESEIQKENIREKNRKIIAGLSHDLKTPITVLQGYIHAIKYQMIPEQEQERYFNIIEKKIELLSELVDSFGEYTKLEHPDFRVHMEHRDLYEYIREYFAMKYEEIEMFGYNLNADIPEGSLYMEFDSMQIKRLFENLLINTMRHTESGAEIYICVKKEESWVRIQFGDNGSGIPSQYRERIFEPFVVGNDARTSGKGSGLGLSIVRKIVELHGGTIRLLDLPGTMFDIKIPLS